MLIHLSNIIQRGIIDNTVHGLTELHLWYHGREEPLHYTLTGDCCQDIAGCRVEFSNRAWVPNPKGDWEALTHIAEYSKHLNAGDITLSRLLQDENNSHTLRRSLSIEFFVDTRIRILIDVDYFDFEISSQHWESSWEEENLRALLSQNHLRAHIEVSVTLFSQHQMGIDSDDFERCVWDDVLNRAESRSAIYRTVREKYLGEDNSLASMAYILNMPHLLDKWAQLDSGIIPSRAYDATRILVLFDYLESAHRRPVHHAMQHPLFQYTNEMTQLISSSLQQYIENHERAQEETEELMQQYSRIVSRILASILLHQQSRSNNQQRTILLGRIAHLKKRLNIVFAQIPSKINNLTDIQLSAKRLRKELEEFRHEILR